YAGQVVELGSTKQIFTEPKHPYTRSLLRSMPQSDDKQEELSEVSPLVKAVTDKELGDERFFFPKQMLGTPEEQQEIFQPYYQEFLQHIKNDRLI
uniref:oligopeptide/dipeptide ABC transporter ATP-binding protein n=1 Tax=uncultured Ligilactobacillus sp. TaxID=2837633 RepID=UPI00351D5C4F